MKEVKRKEKAIKENVKLMKKKRAKRTERKMVKINIGRGSEGTWK